MLRKCSVLALVLLLAIADEANRHPLASKMANHTIDKVAIVMYFFVGDREDQGLVV